MEASAVVVKHIQVLLSEKEAVLLARMLEDTPFDLEQERELRNKLVTALRAA